MVSKMLQVLCLQPYYPTTDAIVYSCRTKGILRMGAQYLELLRCGNFAALPAALVLLLLEFDILVPEGEEEATVITLQNQARTLDGLDAQGELPEILAAAELLHYAQDRQLLRL